jgi:hypothetical protein
MPTKINQWTTQQLIVLWVGACLAEYLTLVIVAFFEDMNHIYGLSAAGDIAEVTTMVLFAAVPYCALFLTWEMVWRT